MAYIRYSQILTFAFVTLVTVYTCKGCFIRNCPPGGKRSGGVDMVARGTRPCLPCGPDNSGQCVGPSICCGHFGCYFGTPESRFCAKENDSTEPCEIRGMTCGSRGQGNCVADGMCCDSLACSYNSKCRSRTNEGTDSAELLSLLNRLLEARGD